MIGLNGTTFSLEKKPNPTIQTSFQNLASWIPDKKCKQSIAYVSNLGLIKTDKDDLQWYATTKNLMEATM